MRHEWVFSPVTRLHQVSYHTFYQWVTYDWREPRPLFSFICDLSEWTTGISRLLNSLNAWRQGLLVLIKAGSRMILFTREVEDEDRGGTRGDRGGRRGRGSSFCAQKHFWLSLFLALLRGCVWGRKDAFISWRKWIYRTVSPVLLSWLCRAGWRSHQVLFT